VLIAVAIVALCLVPTGAIAGEPELPVPDIAGAMLNVAAATLLFGTFGLFAAQVAARRRTAAIAAIVAMLACHFADTIPLVAQSFGPMRYLSPLYLTSRTTALANGHVDWLALAGVAVLALAVGVLAFVMAVRRDIFATFPLGARLPRLPRPRLAGWSLPLRSPFTRALRDAAGPSTVWTIGLALLAAMLTALVPNVRQALLDSAASGVAEQLEKAGLLSSSGIIELMVISFATPIVALFALTLAASWAHEETADRLGFELATPVPRRSLFLGRFAAAAVAIAALVAFVALAVIATAWLRGVSIPAGRFTGAMLLLVVLGVAVAAVGFAISGIRPGATAAITGLFVAISYFGESLLALAGAPGWLRDFSVFALYGQPLIDGISAYQPIALVAIAAIAAAIGVSRFERRDIAR
jgi:putative exporter of polyketide antibiotics